MNIFNPAVGMICGVAIAAAPVWAQTIPLQKKTDCPNSMTELVDSQLWAFPSGQRGDYKEMLRSIDHSLKYMSTPSSLEAYKSSKIPGFTHYRVEKSLKRFRKLVRTAKSPEDLAKKVHKQFDLYQSIGKDGEGKVQFTSYFEPTYTASRQRTDKYRYPLYTAPADLKTWPQPHPTRATLEGKDALGGTLKGNELVWLSDRLDAYLVQVQGSARLQMTDNTTMSIGFDGKTDYDYVSLGKELIKDGRFAENELSLPRLISFFKENPEEMDTYLPRNNRFIFFRATNGTPATGSIGVPVTAERSIATDKSIMPPGALALFQTKLPVFTADNKLEFQPVSRYVLDQDTGSAIKGPGRVDIFMGTGKDAGQRAGLVNNEGKLYYLLLKK